MSLHFLQRKVLDEVIEAIELRAPAIPVPKKKTQRALRDAIIAAIIIQPFHLAIHGSTVHSSAPDSRMLISTNQSQPANDR